MSTFHVVPAPARRSPDEEPGVHELTAFERGLLDFEARHPRVSTAKDDAIRAEFSLSVAQYAQILATLIETPAALAYDPLLMSRLRRLRDARAAERETRRAQRRASAATTRRQHWETP